jgi:hypothetical protein
VFSAAENAFFAAGEEIAQSEYDEEYDLASEDNFDDLPTGDRPGFWSRLRRR